MNLYQVKNKFAEYGLQKYLVVTQDEENAIKLASKELREYDNIHHCTYDKKAFKKYGLKTIEFKESIINGTYLEHFEVKLLIVDVSKETVIERDLY